MAVDEIFILKKVRDFSTLCRIHKPNLNQIHLQPELGILQHTAVAEANLWVSFSSEEPA